MNKTKFNILLICHLPLKKELGGAKVYLEVAESYRNLGHQVELVSIADILKNNSLKFHDFIIDPNLNLKLKEYIKQKVSNYDVIEFEAPYLSFSRDEFPTSTLFVARTTLLELHLNEIKLPQYPGKFFKTFVKNILIKLKLKKSELEQKNRRILQSFTQADLINVPNNSDIDIILRSGIQKSKVVLAPYALSQSRKVQLAAIPDWNQIKDSPHIIFIGTFDNRTGAVEMPKLFDLILTKYPNSKFTLLGAQSSFSTKESVINYFPQHIQKSLDVIMTFDSVKLSEYLINKHIGIFPSHLESFGFGAMEMMCAGLPIAAYKVPGPDLFVPAAELVERGNYRQMSEIIFKLIESKKFYDECSNLNSAVVKDFEWDRFNLKVLEAYSKFKIASTTRIPSTAAEVIPPA